MNQILVLPTFQAEAKRLARKFKSLKNELSQFIEKTEIEGIQGIQLGGGLYKARLAVKSKGKGKSGGMRIISWQNIIAASDGDKIYLVAIYDKSELSNLDVTHINKILRSYGI